MVTQLCDDGGGFEEEEGQVKMNVKIMMAVVVMKE
jgi:hypothetical protein